MEICSAIRTLNKASFGLHINRCPTGVYEFVGHVPVELAFVDPTPESLERAKFGGRFGPRRRVFESREAALKFAEERGYKVDS